MTTIIGIAAAIYVTIVVVKSIHEQGMEKQRQNMVDDSHLNDTNYIAYNQERYDKKRK